jgi:hypothetical protein
MFTPKYQNKKVFKNLNYHEPKTKSAVFIDLPKISITWDCPFIGIEKRINRSVSVGK